MSATRNRPKDLEVIQVMLAMTYGLISDTIQHVTQLIHVSTPT